MQISNTQTMNDHFLSVYPEEGCGVVVNNKFVPCDNIADDKVEDFRISSKDYLKYQKIQGVIHSHTDPYASRFDKRTPSMHDMQGQKVTDLPWGIVNTEGENVSNILWFGLNKPVKILGRQFIHNVYDCLTCTCDYIKLEFNISIPTFPRPMEWDDFNKNFITDSIKEAGFKLLPKETKLDDLVKGDVILFQIRGNYVNHVGVYVGNGKFYHHLIGQLSREDVVMKWNKNIVMYLRHEELM